MCQVREHLKWQVVKQETYVFKNRLNKHIPYILEYRSTSCIGEPLLFSLKIRDIFILLCIGRLASSRRYHLVVQLSIGIDIP